MSLKYTLDFTGKTVIVTGAAGGLGLTLAQAFYANGANVVITDISDERLAKAPESFPKDEAASSNGEVNEKEEEKNLNGEKEGQVVGEGVKERFLAVKCDSSSESEVAALMEQVVQKFGKLDVLVNNAAVNDDMEPAGDCGMEMWERNIKVNLTAPFVTSKAAIGEFLKKELEIDGKRVERGVILNVISAAGVRGYRSGAAYTASKHGLVGLTRNTAAFYSKKGIRCVAILPGAMQTNMAESHLHGRTYHEEGVKLAGSSFASGMLWNELEEVAKTVLAMCCEGMGTVSGSLVACDNGWTCV